MEKYVGIQEAADILNCHVDTLRNWEEKNLLVPIRTKGGHRRYKLSDIEKMLGTYKEPKFTLENRLILINQYELLSLLDPSSKEDNDKYIEALSSGYEPHYPGEWLVTDTTMDDEECSEIRQILQMFSYFQTAYNEMKDKEGLTKKDLAFPGFDGNFESNALSYTRFLIEKENRFQDLEFTNNDWNSHYQYYTKYKIMLKEWKKIESSKPYRSEVTKEEIIKVLSFLR